MNSGINNDINMKSKYVVKFIPNYYVKIKPVFPSFEGMLVLKVLTKFHFGNKYKFKSIIAFKQYLVEHVNAWIVILNENIKGEISYIISRLAWSLDLMTPVIERQENLLFNVVIFLSMTLHHTRALSNVWRTLSQKSSCIYKSLLHRFSGLNFLWV